MLWLLLATSTACAEALKDVFSKMGLKRIDEYTLTFCLCILTVLCLLPVLFWTGLPQIQPQFWLALLINGSLNTLAFSLYVKAIKHSDLSITLPIVNFTPFFLLITSPLIVQESLNCLDFVGSLMIILGSYVLNIKKNSGLGWTPIQSALREQGPKLMLVVALIWSISSNFDKLGVQNSSPLVWAIALYTFVSLILLPVVLIRSKRQLPITSRSWATLLPMGMFNALGMYCQMQALTLTLVVNVIAIKRTSTLIGALLGCFLFQEQNIKQRLLGTIVMISGVILIAQT
ncbi:MAG: EamA family transporter [Cyanothece sp. SIO1E1]|nr:EamA family transporter [Cyanothece sp. SIO1E1]